MLRKRIKVLALLMAVLFLLPVHNIYGTALASEQERSKILSTVTESTENFNGPYPVYIATTVQAADYRRLLAWTENDFEEYVQNIRKEIGLENNRLFLQTIYSYLTTIEFLKIALFGRDQIDIPLMAVWLTKEEMDQVACFDKVKVVTDIYQYFYYPVVPESYNATFALYMLEVSVGLRLGISSFDIYDVNRDGSITAVDALLALQESVGLIAIARTNYLGAWMCGQSMVRDLAYDWEKEQIPENLFFYANHDVNGDGKIDCLDIIVKFDYLWVW